MKKKTLVIGASSNPSRYSYLAVQRLLANGQDVVALGRKTGTIEGVEIEIEPKQFEGVHTVSLYLNPTNQKDYYNYIVSLKPQRVIFNPGTENPEFYKVLEANGIGYEVACTLVLLSIGEY